MYQHVVEGFGIGIQNSQRRPAILKPFSNGFGASKGNFLRGASVSISWEGFGGPTP